MTAIALIVIVAHKVVSCVYVTVYREFFIYILIDRFYISYWYELQKLLKKFDQNPEKKLHDKALKVKTLKLPIIDIISFYLY